MGTRGYVVIKINNKYYCYYNQFDSYPSNLGKNILDELSEINYAEYKEKLRELESNTESCDWPGSLEDLLDENKLYNFKPDAEDDPEDLHYNPIKNLYNDIFIEYVYKIDFDNDEFEMYCMWNKFRMLGDLNDIPFTNKVFDMFSKKC
jgi:Fe-S cluster biosynthesis and repair protein YggX